MTALWSQNETSQVEDEDSGPSKANPQSRTEVSEVLGPEHLGVPHPTKQEGYNRTCGRFCLDPDFGLFQKQYRTGHSPVTGASF